jgi:hypothetical protein
MQTIIREGGIRAAGGPHGGQLIGRRVAVIDGHVAPWKT